MFDRNLPTSGYLYKKKDKGFLNCNNETIFLLTVAVGGRNGEDMASIEIMVDSKVGAHGTKITHRASPSTKEFGLIRLSPEPVFVNVYGAQKLIPRNRLHQPKQPGGPVRQIGLSYCGPPGWESITGLLKRFTSSGSAYIRKFRMVQLQSHI